MLTEIKKAFETAATLGHEIKPRWPEEADILLGLKSQEILPYTNTTDFNKEWDKEKKDRLKNISTLLSSGQGAQLVMLPLRMDDYTMGYIVAVTGFRDVRKTFWVLHMDSLVDHKVRLTYCLLPMSKARLAVENFALRDKAIDYIEGLVAFRDKVRLSLNTQGNFFYQGKEFNGLDETVIPAQHPKLVFALLKEHPSDPMTNVLLHEVYEHFVDNPDKYAF